MSSSTTEVPRAARIGIGLAGAAVASVAIAGSVIGITISTAVLMILFCPWSAVFGWKLLQQGRASTPH